MKNQIFGLEITAAVFADPNLYLAPDLEETQLRQNSPIREILRPTNFYESQLMRSWGENGKTE
jgi:hypothetical protein